MWTPCPPARAAKMAAYATPEDFARYCPGEAPAGEELTAALERAGAQVDGLCFGRIRRRGFDRLTEFQRENIKRAVCLHAAFLSAYGDAVESPLASYGINGVSMAFDASRVVGQGGVITSKEVYGLLLQTGLAHRGVW